MSLQAVVQSCLQGLGYELVDLDWRAGGHLRVFIEHRMPADGAAITTDSSGPIPQDGSGIRIEDCEQVSHQLSHVLTVENIDYTRLEVSSPGLDRPLRTVVEFERFVGSDVSVKLKFARDGRRVFEGRLVAVTDGQVVVDVIDAPQAAVASGRRGKVVGARRRPRSSAVAAPGSSLRLTLVLDDIERARLVPRLRF